ncbi:MAG: DMT family transporter [Bosea sp. (in: a-proteobacteria)]
MPGATNASNRRGIVAMVAAQGTFVINDAFVKLATATYPTGQVLAIRGVFAALAALVLVRLFGRFSDLKAMASPLVMARGGLEALIAFTFITALAHLPLANITAILQAATLIVVLMAAILGIERIGWRRLLAIMVGFVGVLIIVRPAAEGFTVYSLVALASAIMVGARDLLTRRIGAHVPSTVITFTTTAVVCAVGWIIGMAETWQPLALKETLYLVGAALFVAAGNYSIIVAYRDADVSLVSGFRYTVLVFAILLGILIWGDWPDLPALAGASLIVGSGLYTLHRQRVRGQVPIKEQTQP